MIQIVKRYDCYVIIDPVLGKREKKKKRDLSKEVLCTREEKEKKEKENLTSIINSLLLFFPVCFF